MSEHTTKRSSPNITLAVLLLGGAAYAVLSSAVIPALSTMQHDLHTTESGIAWLLTGYLLAASVGTSIIGRLGDMYGKERLLVWTLGALAAGTLLSAVSHSLGLVVAGRVIQGAGGGIYPLAYGIMRDEFPREKVAGSIGIMSAILGVGGGAGIVLSGPIIEHLGWHWLFWFPLMLIVLAAVCTWRFVPESPVRVEGRINWLAALLMTVGMTISLLAISQTTEWGWGSARTLGLLAIGIVICIFWVITEVRSREPLIDMTMMRIRGVWTTNLAAFLLGGGMYTAFLIYPEFAQLAKPVGYGASEVTAGLYLLPMALTMAVIGTTAGRIAARVGSKVALVAGSASTMVAFALLAITHAHSYDMLISSLLAGIGVGLAFSALGNLIVEAVAPEQTGVATGMNTVTRTLGGALGGQISATFIAAHVLHGTPQTTGFSQSFVMCTAFLLVALLASMIVPGRRRGGGIAEQRGAEPSPLLAEEPA
ncbi:MAG TPA: MFS transporter [Solirubrobacteraceae bacterium]|jgi:EmrB/QacA subfamily drug resistance transporter